MTIRQETQLCANQVRARTLAFWVVTYVVSEQLATYLPRTPSNDCASWRAGDRMFCRQDCQEKKFRPCKEKCCILFCPSLIMGQRNRTGQSNALHPRLLHPRQARFPHCSPHYSQGNAPALDTGCMGRVTTAPSRRALPYVLPARACPPGKWPRAILLQRNKTKIRKNASRAGRGRATRDCHGHCT